MKDMMDQQLIKTKRFSQRTGKNEFELKYLYSMVLENRFIKFNEFFKIKELIIMHNMKLEFMQT